jgi:iron complex transport system permease protein
MFRPAALWIPALFVLLLAAVAASLTLGRYPVPVADVARILLTTAPVGATHDASDAPWVVVEMVRLPRVLLAALCGMNLALAGTAMQGVFRNPLVGPEVCGVTAGASFGGVLSILLGWSAAATVGLAFAFGLGALGATFLLARLAGNGGTLALVLAGVIVGTLFGALVGLAQHLADPLVKLPSIVYWLLGSFAGSGPDKVLVVSCATLAAGLPLLALGWRINLLSLGESDLRALGIDASALRWGIVALVALLVAAQVSVSGGVGWVGLVVPHIARMLVGPEHSRLLPASALLGGLYLLLMDDLARTAAPQEIPIGLLTATIGAPAFALLFWKLRDRGWGHE